MEEKRQAAQIVYISLVGSTNNREMLWIDETIWPDNEELNRKTKTDDLEDESVFSQTAILEDAYVVDGVIDDDVAEVASVSWDKVLPDGESILERQLRMLAAQGIQDFVLGLEKYEVEAANELANSLLRCLPGGIHMRCIAYSEMIRDICQLFSKDETFGSAIILPGNAVYDWKFAKELLKGEKACSFLSKSMANRRYADKFGRIDFKYVREIGPQEKGASWFPFLSIYKFDAARAVTLESSDNPMLAIEDKISELEMVPVFENNGYIRLPKDEKRLATAYKEVLARDYISRRIEKGPACTAELSDWLEQLQVHKPILIYDQKGANAPIGDILAFYSIPYKKVLQLDGSASVDSIKDLVMECKRGEYDCVISVGGESATQAAKLLRVCMRFDTEPSENMNLSRAVRFFPHISIPLIPTAAMIMSSSGKFSPAFGANEIKPSHMIPDILALDPVIMMKPDDEMEEPAVEMKKQFSVKNWLRKTVPGPIRLLQTAMLKWYYMTKRMNNQAVVFESYHGAQVTCNPYAMYEAMKSCPDYKGFSYIWAVNRPGRYRRLSKQSDTRVVKRNSLKHIRALATSRFVVSNMSVPPFFKPGKEQIYINTWHGKLIKNIGVNVANELVGNRGNRQERKTVIRNAKRFTYILSPARVFTPWMISAFDLKRLHRENIIRETGYPRNDFLFRFTEKDVLRVKLKLGIPLNRKVVLYAPTWRSVDYGSVGYVYQNPIDFTKLKEELGDEYVILFRAHNLEAASISFTELGDSVIDVTRVRDVNDLLIVSDLLISDYSGIIYDFANLRRPIILFHYDREDYTKHQAGVYIDLDILPGYVVTDGKDLGKAIPEAIHNFVYDEKYQQFNAVYNGLDGADCGLRTVKELIPADLTPTERQRHAAELRRKNRQAKCHINAFLRTIGLGRKDNDRRILSYKNKHKGERCFLVGNGPSLRVEDLEAIRNEYSFACNKIYKSFDRMKWRPTYYFFTDKVFESELDKIRKTFAGQLFSNENFNKPQYEKYDIIYAHTMSSQEYYVHGNMLEYYVPSAATVMTFMIEMAIYMGFSEIYLIGVDASNSFVNTNDHFMKGYMTSEMETVEQRRTRELATGDKKLTLEELGRYRVDRSMAAYSKLREYADKHGIKVYNATRGGMLEAFERVDLDAMKLK